MKRAVLVFLLLAALPLAAETLPFERGALLRDVSHAWIIDHGQWITFLQGAAFATYSSESGPEVQRNEGFSTNFVAAGAQRSLGSRGLVLFRGRMSLEPFTIKEEGYPQMLQWVSPEAGGPLLDRMRAHDLIGEAAAQIAFRTSAASYIHLYGAAVGDPALGALPYAQRDSGLDFAEAPFAYDVQETTHDSTRVVTLGWTSQFLKLEASVFHDAVTTGDHSSIDDGDIDSRSARLTITPGSNLSFQVSKGELGDAKYEVTSASATWKTDNVASTALYTRRETPAGVALTAFSFELALRARRNTVMGRVESVDRPPLFLGATDTKRTTHVTIGYIFDVISATKGRVGIGANIDYHTNYRDLPARYGHKPQAIYTFVRVRTD